MEGGEPFNRMWVFSINYFIKGGWYEQENRARQDKG